MVSGMPTQSVMAGLLGSTQLAWQEVWLSDEPIRQGHDEGIVWRRTGDVLFGVLEIAEDPQASSHPLQRASDIAYDRIFRLLQAHQLPYLWRAWNYLPDINREMLGLERYRQFNIGRQDAFIRHRQATQGNVPTACALGVHGGPLSIAFLAGATPALPIENPRQVSAYEYPADYGPRAPTFSRAALVYPAGQELLLISGTASIVGHQTVHHGDVHAQSQEVLNNISAVIEQANRHAKSRPFAMDELICRVYVRHASDFETVRAVMAPRLGQAHAVYLQADVCRSDLLVEMEAIALHGLD